MVSMAGTSGKIKSGNGRKCRTVNITEGRLLPFLPSNHPAKNSVD